MNSISSKIRNSFKSIISNPYIVNFTQFSYGPFVSMFIGFLIIPITTFLLTPEDYGKYSMYSMAFTAIIVITSLGLDQAFIRFFNDVPTNELPILAQQCVKMSFIALLIGSCIIIFFGDPIAIILFSQPSLYLLYILILNVLFQLFQTFPLQNLRMQQKAKRYSAVIIIQAILRFTVTLGILLLWKQSFEALILSQFIVIILGIMVLVIIEKDFFLKFIGAFFKKNQYRFKSIDLLAFGISFLPSFVVYTLFESIDKIALRKWASFEELGLYNAAFKFVMALSLLNSIFVTFWTPLAYKKIQNPASSTFFKNAFVIVSFFLVTLSVILITSKDILIMIMHKRFSSAAEIIPCLVFVPILYTLSEIPVIYINYSKKTFWHIPIALSALIANCVGNYILIPMLGAKGAAISTGLSYIVFFSLRFIIGRYYFHVDHNVFNLFFKITALFGFALFSTLVPFTLIHLIVGLSIIITITLWDKKQLITLFKSDSLQ